MTELSEHQGPELKKLIDRFTKSGVKNFHVSWGPEAHKLTTEEQASAINNMLEQGEAQEKDRLDVRRADLKAVYTALYQLVLMSKYDIDELFAADPPKDIEFRSRVGCIANMACLHGRQILPSEDVKDCRIKAQSNINRSNNPTEEDKANSKYMEDMAMSSFNLFKKVIEQFNHLT